MRAAKQLVGEFVSCKPDNPEAFIASIGAVLSQYPPDLVDECCDPRCGVARKVEFLSVKSLVEWLDGRLIYYRSLAMFVPRLRKIDVVVRITDDERERNKAALRGIARAMTQGRDLEPMTFAEFVTLGTK